MITRFIYWLYQRAKHVPLAGRILGLAKPIVQRLLYPKGFAGGLLALQSGNTPAFYPWVPLRPVDADMVAQLRSYTPPGPTLTVSLPPLRKHFRISVVISTLNRGSSLARTLSALQFQRHKPFEVVVVVGPCEDATRHILSSWESFVKIVDCEEANISRSRNIGVLNATGEIICFLDDDAIPEPQWLSGIARAYLTAGAFAGTLGGVGGMIVTPNGNGFAARGLILDRLARLKSLPDEAIQTFAHEQRPGNPHAPATTGCNASFRRDALIRIGGFDEYFSYYLDESDVNVRLMDAGLVQSFACDAVVVHKCEPSTVRPLAAGSLLNGFVPARSMGYFCVKHGLTRYGAHSLLTRLEHYRNSVARHAAWLRERLLLSTSDYDALLMAVDSGLRQGVSDAVTGRAPSYPLSHSAVSDLSPFRPFRTIPIADQPLRVCLLSQENPFTSTNGIGSWTRTLATGLARRGHEVTVVCRASPAADRDFIDGVWLHAIEDEKSLSGIGAAGRHLPSHLARRALANQSEVRRILGSKGLDIVSGPIWDAETVELVASDALPVCTSLHTTYALAQAFKPAWTGRAGLVHPDIRRVIAAEKYVLTASTCLLANSQTLITDVEKAYGVDLGGRTRIVPHGCSDLSSEPFVPAPPCKGPRVVYFGRLELRKGCDLLLAAIPIVLDGLADAEVAIIGDANIPLDETGVTALQQAEHSGLLPRYGQRIRFLGVLERPSLIGWLRSADVVALPSRYESFGLVYIEAASLSKAIVALDIPVVRELLDGGKAAATFSQPTPELYAATLLSVLSDSRHRQALGSSARALYEERYRDTRMLDQIEDMFVRCIEKFRQ
jgi:glycogen(starch) synthase